MVPGLTWSSSTTAWWWLCEGIYGQASAPHQSDQTVAAPFPVSHVGSVAHLLGSAGRSGRGGRQRQAGRAGHPVPGLPGTTVAPILATWSLTAFSQVSPRW